MKKKLLSLQGKRYFQEVNPETGECVGDVISTDFIIKEIPRTGFAITYISTIVNLIENIGNKKMQVVKYVLQNMDSNNLLTKTIREIAEGSGCSLQTVHDTLKILEDCGIITRKVGVVMLSPKLVHKGNAQRERFLMTKFVEIKNGE